MISETYPIDTVCRPYRYKETKTETQTETNTREKEKKENTRQKTRDTRPPLKCDGLFLSFGGLS